MEANDLLTGVGIVPISKTILQGFLENEHVVLHEEAENDELEEDFMRRVFDKALRNPDFIKSTRQCLIIHIPGGHEKRSIGGTELLDSYVNKWMVGDAGFQMYWGVYEIPGASRMQITIVANMTALAKEKTETVLFERNL